MRNPHYTNPFEKDLKLAKKRGWDLTLIEDILDLLIDEKILPPKNKDHALKGNYLGYRECHILSDWLLIYKIDGEDIYFARTGTHSDLFE